MRMRILSVACGLLVVVALCGSVQMEAFVGSLKVSDGAYIAVEANQLVLVHQPNGTPLSPLPTSGPEPLDALWQISAPYLRTPHNKFMAIEQRCTGVRVFLEANKTDSAKWVIEVIAATRAQSKRYEHTKLLWQGTDSTKFRLSIFDGPNKGWYLAASEPISEPVATNAPKVVTREFMLTQDRQKALLFDYVERKFWIR